MVGVVSAVAWQGEARLQARASADAIFCPLPLPTLPLEAMRRSAWRPWWSLVLATCVLCLPSLALALPDHFNEHLTLRPLPDGRLHTLFSFELQSGGQDSASLPIYSTVPRSLVHLARASEAEEVHLAINAGRWDYERWGQAGEEDMVGTGAEVWARLRSDGREGLGQAKWVVGWVEEAVRALTCLSPCSASIPATTMANWRKLTANLAGLFCASLDALDERLTIEPFFDRDESTSTTTLHALLSSESICTENLSTLLKLLPCKTTSGLASLLKPHYLFKSDFHGMTLHIKRAEQGWHVKLNVQAVFAPVMQPYRQKRGALLVVDLPALPASAHS